MPRTDSFTILPKTFSIDFFFSVVHNDTSKVKEVKILNGLARRKSAKYEETLLNQPLA